MCVCVLPPKSNHYNPGFIPRDALEGLLAGDLFPLYMCSLCVYNVSSTYVFSLYKCSAMGSRASSLTTRFFSKYVFHLCVLCVLLVLIVLLCSSMSSRASLLATSARCSPSVLYKCVPSTYVSSTYVFSLYKCSAMSNDVNLQSTEFDPCR